MATIAKGINRKQVKPKVATDRSWASSDPNSATLNKNDLPAGWTLCKLEDLLDYIQPTDYIVESTDYRDNYKTPVLTPGKSFIKGYTNETKGIFNDLPVIIFDDFTTANKFVNFPFKVKSSAMKILKPKTGANIKFAFYFMQTLKVSTDTHKRYWISVYSKLGVSLPPPKVQHAIVSKIEGLLSELDKGKQQLETAKQQLKVYRQAVLKWAFEGKLTGGNENWTTVRLGDLANAIDPQPSHRTPPKVKGGIPFVSIKDFDSEQDKIDFSKARLVSSNVLKEHHERYELQKGDFVIGKIGTIGKPVRIVLPQNYTLSANIVLIQPRKIDPTFLYYFFQSNIIKKEFLAGTRATTQAAFGIQKVREMKIQLPPAEEQNKIVQEIESRLRVCDKVEETITTSLAQAETLRQSILKKAFEGKLV